MLDYERNVAGYEVFDCYSGETVATCSTIDVAFELMSLLEGKMSAYVTA